MNPSPPQASTQTSTGSQAGGGGESSRRGVSNRPNTAMNASVTAASTSHQSGRESHQPRLSGSTPSPNPPSSIDAPITDTIAVRCQR